MKGLLYKDLCIMRQVYRTWLMICLLFLIVSFLNPKNPYWAVYSVFMLSSMVSGLQSMDETQKWTLYCEILPITRSLQVTEKFLLSLLVVLAYTLFYTVAQGILSLFGFGLSFSETCLIAGMIIVTGAVSISVSLTTAFLFGPQKSQLGRMVLIAVTVGCGMLIITQASAVLSFLQSIPAVFLSLGIPLLSLLLFAAGWKISCIGYEKRTFQ